MEYRVLGKTGVHVSRLGLGAMVLGAWGNTDHRSCERIIHRALDGGINLVDTADVYAFGESEEIVGAALQGRRDDIVLATKFHNQMGPDQNQRGNSRRWIMKAVDRQLASFADRLDRSLPSASTRPAHGDRRDSECAVRSRALGQDPLLGHVDLSGRRHSRGAVVGRIDRRVSRRIASNRRTRSSVAASSVTCSPCASATEWASSRGARSRADGSRASTGATLPHRRAAAVRPTPTTSTACNPTKLDAVDALSRSRGRSRRVAHASRAGVERRASRGHRRRSSGRVPKNRSTICSAPVIVRLDRDTLDRIDADRGSRCRPQSGRPRMGSTEPRARVPASPVTVPALQVSTPVKHHEAARGQKPVNPPPSAMIVCPVT